MWRLLIALVLAVPASSAASTGAADQDPAYGQANARLARAVPRYPGARQLVQEAMHGEVGPVPYEAFARVSFLARPQTQRGVLRFYARRLGPSWKQRGTTCLVSGRRLVVAVVNAPRRRLGMLVDSRGAARCYDLTGIIADLLHVGYPDP